MDDDAESLDGCVEILDACIETLATNGAIQERQQATVRRPEATIGTQHAPQEGSLVVLQTSTAILPSCAPDARYCATSDNTDTGPTPWKGAGVASEPAAIPLRNAGTNAFRQIVCDAATCVPTSARPSTTQARCVA